MEAYVAINEANFHIDGMLSGDKPVIGRKGLPNQQTRLKRPSNTAIDALLTEAES